MGNRELRVAGSCMAVLVVTFTPGRLVAQTAAPSAPAPQQHPVQPTSMPSSQSSEHPAHQVKIWTNEDLVETRTPTDRYIFSKEEKAATDQAAEFQAITSCFAPDHREPTPEETQKDIADTTKSIAEAEEGVAQAKRQVEGDPENLRTRDQAELNRRTSELNRLLEHLHALQMRLQESGSQAGGPAASPAPPSEPPPSL
jgi:hypothetical protein